MYSLYNKTRNCNSDSGFAVITFAIYFSFKFKNHVFGKLKIGQTCSMRLFVVFVCFINNSKKFLLIRVMFGVVFNFQLLITLTF